MLSSWWVAGGKVKASKTLFKKLEKAVTVDFKTKHPAQKAGTRSRAISTQGSRRVALCPNSPNLNLVAHYSAISDTISCDAPYSAIGFRGKFLCDAPPSKARLSLAIGHLYGRSGVVAAIVCNTTQNTA